MKKRKLQGHPVRMFHEEDFLNLPEGRMQPVVLAELCEGEEEEILVLNVYDRKELAQEIYRPLYRVFQTKTEYRIQDLKKGKWCSGALLYLILGFTHWRCYSFLERLDILDAESEQIIREYFGETGEKTDTMSLVYHVQEHIIDRKREQRNQKKQEKINQKMERISPVDDSFKKWTEEEALYWSRFIFYKYSRKKKIQGWCTHCKREVVLEKGMPRHNKKGICPACKSPVTFISSGRKPYFMYHWRRVSKLERIEDKILYREFYVHKFYHGIYPETWEFGCSETLRLFLDMDGNVESYARRNWGDEQKQWHKSKKNARDAVLYPEDVYEALADTPYRYCALGDYIKNNPRKDLYTMGYLKAYLIFPGLEYFVKAGLYKMVFDIMEYPYIAKELKEGRSLKTVLGIESVQELELVRNNLVGFLEFKNAQKFLRAGVKLTNQELILLFKLYGDDSLLLRDNTLLPLKKLASYITKQVERFGECSGFSLIQDAGLLNNKIIQEHERFLKIWRDYVGFMKALNYEVTGENVLCPYNLIKEHDRVYAEYQKMMDKKAAAEKRRKDRALKQKLEKEGKLLEGKIKNKKYQLVVPKSAADIRREGRLLGHCVGSYTDSVLAGHCQIYFIRKKEELETPYYTLEWQNGKIYQCRGKKNCGYNKEMERFLKTAEQKLKQLKKMPEKAA